MKRNKLIAFETLDGYCFDNVDDQFILVYSKPDPGLFCGLEKLSYAYQYQDRDGNLVFRYDNAAHKPKLDFVEHKHSSAGIEMVKPPVMSELIDEVIACL